MLIFSAVRPSHYEYADGVGYRRPIAFASLSMAISVGYPGTISKVFLEIRLIC